jgi:hypothetical protein
MSYSVILKNVKHPYQLWFEGRNKFKMKEKGKGTRNNKR